VLRVGGAPPVATEEERAAPGQDIAHQRSRVGNVAWQGLRRCLGQLRQLAQPQDRAIPRHARVHGHLVSLIS
jgi:hypothetical protein